MCARVFECMRASARPFFHFGFSFVLFRVVLAMCVLFSFFRSSSSSSSFSNLPTINNTILHTHTRSHASHSLDKIACRHVVYYIWRDQVASCIFLVLFLLFLLLSMMTAMMIQTRILLSLQMNGMASTQRTIHQTKTE